MKTSESTQIITKLIPKLIQEAKIPLRNIKTDCGTYKTDNKRIDIIISKEENNSCNFENDIITIIEVKKENDSYMDIYSNNGDNVNENIKLLIEKNLKLYEDGKELDYTNIEEKAWFNGLIQGLWKAKRLQVNFFAVSNIKRTVFYHTNTLKRIELQRTIEKVVSGKVVKEDCISVLKGIPSYSLLNDMSLKLTEDIYICDYRDLQLYEQNEKSSMNEKEFIEFLERMHTEFYKGSLSGKKKYLGDVILTFLFFKYLEERVQITGQRSRYLKGRVKLWSEWTNSNELEMEDDEVIGEEVYDAISTQLSLLKNDTDEKDKNGKYKKGYENEYRDFFTILADIKQIPENQVGYSFIGRIYKELNGINTSNRSKQNSLYLHSCNFDVYGAIYEKFKEKDEKEEFGQFYTKRHISKILAKLTLRPYVDRMKREIFNYENECEEKGSLPKVSKIIDIIIKHYSDILIIDPSCGTGGLLTECYEYLEQEYREILNKKNNKIEELLSNRIFTGMDIEDDCVKKAKLNMFFAGDGHTKIYHGNSLHKLNNQKIELNDDCSKNPWNVIISNPPYGKMKEYTFMKKYIDSLPFGGRIGIIIPNGILENPSKNNFREYIIKNIRIESIISLNKFVFAPYTKQKTYMVIGYKRDESTIKQLEEDEVQSLIESEEEIVELEEKEERILITDLKEKIWCYILDFDGYNLSDNRWPTDLMIIENNIPRYIHNDTFELINDYLKENIEKVNQLDIEGEIIGTKNDEGKYILKKSKYITLNQDITKENYYNLLPEFYMRPYSPEYINEDKFYEEVDNIFNEIKELLQEIEEVTK